MTKEQLQGADIKVGIGGGTALYDALADAAKSAVHEVEVKPAQKEKLELTYARKYFWNP